MAPKAVRRSFLSLPVVVALVAGAAFTTAAPVGAASALKLKGISVFVTDSCPRPAAAWQALATSNMRSVKALGANSVALSFPYYTASVTSNSVFVANTCPNSNPPRLSPSPARLAVIVKAAHKLHLRVSLRPLLDEAHLAKWRGAITPRNATAWFKSYRSVLAPYLRMAKTTKAEEFGIMGELNSLAGNPNWVPTVSFARHLYPGKLLVVPTWPRGPSNHARGTTWGVDAYPRLPHAKPDATPAQLLAGWNSALKQTKLPAGVTLYEVGINAVDGAYAFPSVYNQGAFDQQIQVNWFTAACNFVKSHNFGGLYYWGQWFEANGGNLLTQPNPGAATQIQPNSQPLIRKCFH
jgi:hypothetical protein